MWMLGLALLCVGVVGIYRLVPVRGCLSWGVGILIGASVVGVVLWLAGML